MFTQQAHRCRIVQRSFLILKLKVSFMAKVVIILKRAMRGDKGALWAELWPWPSYGYFHVGTYCGSMPCRNSPLNFCRASCFGNDVTILHLDPLDCNVERKLMALRYQVFTNFWFTAFVQSGFQIGYLQVWIPLYGSILHKFFFS